MKFRGLPSRKATCRKEISKREASALTALGEVPPQSAWEPQLGMPRLRRFRWTVLGAWASGICLDCGVGEQQNRKHT
jgi:hypothetical protein